MDMIRMSFKVLTIFLIYNNMVNGESDESDYDDYIQFEDVKHMTDNARRQIKNAKRVSNNTFIDSAEGYLKLYNENYYKSYFNVRSKKRNVKNDRERNVEFVKDEGDMNRTERDSLTRKLKVTERDSMTRRFKGTGREKIRESYEEEFDGKEIAIHKRDKRNTNDNPFIITILLNKNEIEPENRTIIPWNKFFKMRVVSEDWKIKSIACTTIDKRKEIFSSDFSNDLTENKTYFESNVKKLFSKGAIDAVWNCIFKTEYESINRKLKLILTNLHDASASIYVNNNEIPTSEVDTYGKFDQIGYYQFENDELVKIQCKVLDAVYVKMFNNEIPIYPSEPLYIRLSEKNPTHIDCTAHNNSPYKFKAYRLEFQLKQEIDTPSFQVNGSNALRFNSTYFTYEYVEGENLEISLFFKKPDIYKSIQCQTENDIDDIVTSNNPIGMNCIIEAIKKDRTLQCTIFKNTSETESTNLVLNLVARDKMKVVPRVFVPLSRVVSSYSKRHSKHHITNFIEYSYKKNDIVEFTCIGSSKNSSLYWDYSSVQIESSKISEKEGIIINTFKLKDNYTISTITCVDKQNNKTMLSETKITLLLKKHEDTGPILGPISALSGFISNFKNSTRPKSEGQTFFEEYWMYIVPASVAIFIIIATILIVSCFKRNKVYLVENTPTQVNENSHNTTPPPGTKTVENAYATPFDTQTNNTEYQLPINHIIDKLYSKPVPKNQRQAKVIYATPDKTKNGLDNIVDIKFDSPYAEINGEFKRSNHGKAVADKVYANCYRQDYTNAYSRTELCDESVYYSEVKND